MHSEVGLRSVVPEEAARLALVHHLRPQLQQWRGGRGDPLVDGKNIGVKLLVEWKVLCMFLFEIY